MTDPGGGGWDLSDLNFVADTLEPDVPALVGSTYGYTDWDNARRLELYEIRSLRYINDRDRWYRWRDVKWAEATPGDRYGIAARTVLRISQEEAIHVDDPDVRAQHIAWGQKSLSESHLRAMINVASGIESFRIESTELDARGHLLNFPNCTLNLTNGETHTHNRNDLITQICPTPYAPSAYSQRLNDFLEKFMPDKEEREYTLQVLATTALSYGNATRKLVLLLGPTSTGKSTLMELVMKTLGRDYVAAVNPSVFRGSLDDKPRPDLLRALNTRLILAFEASERWELHTDQIKRMTGGDALTARGMRSDVMHETIATFVPWVVANQAPTIHGSDAALRRRLLAVTMDTQVPEGEDDGKLRNALIEDRTAREALLALLIRTYRECEGVVTLPIPPRFAELTMELFAALDEVDEVMTWLKDDMTIYPAHPGTPITHYVTTSVLFKCYSWWLDQNGTHQMKRDKLGPKQFTARLKALGYEITRSNGSRVVGWSLGNTRIANMMQF